MQENNVDVIFDAISENESFARVVAAAFVTRLDPTLEEISDIKTAVSEAVTNSIVHGYEGKGGKVYMTLSLEDREIIIKIKDEGVGIENVHKAMEPLYTTKPELERSGMGFSFMEAFMDELNVYSRKNVGTTVIMEKVTGRMDVYACDHTKELIIKAHNNDKSAREKLVIDNSGLVWSIVKRFTGRGAEMEDLYQIGCIGLIKAIDNFNMDYDVKFSTYAVPMITGEIKRFLRDDGIIKISRSIKENGYKCFTASQKLKGILNREPTIEELSRETGIATEDIIVTMEAGDCVESIYKTIYQKDGNEVCLIDKLEGKDGGSDSIIDNIMINELVDSLCERDRKLIRMRYYEDMTQTQAARVLGISQVQVSRLEKKILNRMRSQIDIE